MKPTPEGPALLCLCTKSKWRVGWSVGWRPRYRTASGSGIKTQAGRFTVSSETL